ncbi:PblB-type antireceptor [Salmonella virus STSR3]|nr:PblB-type antireceptor [Salmonella virus STSR3]
MDGATKSRKPHRMNWRKQSRRLRLRLTGCTAQLTFSRRLVKFFPSVRKPLKAICNTSRNRMLALPLRRFLNWKITMAQVIKPYWFTKKIRTALKFQKRLTCFRLRLKICISRFRVRLTLAPSIARPLCSLAIRNPLRGSLLFTGEIKMAAAKNHHKHWPLYVFQRRYRR